MGHQWLARKRLYRWLCLSIRRATPRIDHLPAQLHPKSQPERQPMQGSIGAP
jgi:hypothetical protein